jgi:hypothetical protein
MLIINIPIIINRNNYCSKEIMGIIIIFQIENKIEKIIKDKIFIVKINKNLKVQSHKITK